MKQLFWFYPDKLLIACIAAILISSLTAGIFLGLAYAKLPAIVPLWYSLPWGEARLASKVFLVYLLLGSLLIGILQSTASRFFKTTPSVMYILATVSALEVILASITIIQIIRLW